MAYQGRREPTTILWKPAISEWGKILGTLSNQTDLQTALNAKVPYTGATANVTLGGYSLTALNLIGNSTLALYPASTSNMYLMRNAAGGIWSTGRLIIGSGDVSPNSTIISGGPVAIRDSLKIGENGGTAATMLKMSNAAGIYAILSTANIATSDKTFTFPNASGTFALTSFSRTFLLMGA